MRGSRPTNRILPEPRKVAFITQIPKPKKQKGIQQEKILFDAAAQALGTEAQQYDLSAFIGGVRQRVDRWRELPDPNAWGVTPETARLLTHWRSHRFGDIRPFFCQVEAVETAIWLTEVAPTLGLQRVIDLSATPFFLRGSGYAEGTLFPWTASDFSLMDAIECGIVKLPRVPVADNIPGGEMPKFRNLWEHTRPKMPKRAAARRAGSRRRRDAGS